MPENSITHNGLASTIEIVEAVLLSLRHPGEHNVGEAYYLTVAESFTQYCNAPGLNLSGRAHVLWYDMLAFQGSTKGVYPTGIIYATKELDRASHGATLSETVATDVAAILDMYLSYLLEIQANSCLEAV